MTNGPSLPGSPSRTAIMAPLSSRRGSSLPLDLARQEQPRLVSLLFRSGGVVSVCGQRQQGGDKNSENGGSHEATHGCSPSESVLLSTVLWMDLRQNPAESPCRDWSGTGRPSASCSLLPSLSRHRHRLGLRIQPDLLPGAEPIDDLQKCQGTGLDDVGADRSTRHHAPRYSAFDKVRSSPWASSPTVTL